MLIAVGRERPEVDINERHASNIHNHDCLNTIHEEEWREEIRSMGSMHMEKSTSTLLEGGLGRYGGHEIIRRHAC